MNRRAFVAACSAAAASTVTLLADDDKHAKQGGNHGHGGDDDHGQGHGQGERYFRSEDKGSLRRYYDGPVDLPPGLRKKYYRTGRLPPGWEKRFRPFPTALIQRLPPPPPNCDRGYVDGFAVLYDRRTRVILDVLDIIDVATGR